MIEIITAIVVATALTIISGIKYLLDKWQIQEKIPPSIASETSKSDEEQIEHTQKLIKECFGSDVVKTYRESSKIERINMTNDFAKKLAILYDVDIDIDVDIKNENDQGSYNWEKKKVIFNILLLTVDSDYENFEYIVRETLDTIVHELRHAVQHKAILVKGFWGIDEKRRQKWVDNVANYIPSSVDYEGYAKQPIESDAMTFASKVMEGVFAI